MIEMAEIVSTSSLWADVKHTKANSWTPSCALVSHASVSANAAAWLTGPRGGLFGAGTLLNASGGTNTGYDATALNDFWSSASSSQYTQPGSTLPSLNSADGPDVDRSERFQCLHHELGGFCLLRCVALMRFRP